ncbi:unnamed protein product [Discula destructiva]
MAGRGARTSLHFTLQMTADPEDYRQCVCEDFLSPTGDANTPGLGPPQYGSRQHQVPIANLAGATTTTTTIAFDHNPMWSDTSSSIYSQDDLPMMTDTRALIQRSKSVRSTFSQASTLYSEESIKALGYRPFEYWKPPNSLAKKRRQPPLPPPPPPPLPPAVRLAGTTGTGTRRNPTTAAVPVNALPDFRPMHKARIRKVQRNMDANTATDTDAPPRSPRVKDRYGARGRRYKRSPLRQQQSTTGDEWPGWMPDEKALLGKQQVVDEQRRHKPLVATPRTDKMPLPPAERAAAAAAAAAAASRKTSKKPAPRAMRWTESRTWGRGVWGIVLSVVGLMVLVGLVAALTYMQDKASAGLHARSAAAESLMMSHSLSLEGSAAAAAAAAAASRRMVARRFRG